MSTDAHGRIINELEDMILAIDAMAREIDRFPYDIVPLEDESLAMRLTAFGNATYRLTLATMAWHKGREHLAEGARLEAARNKRAHA